MAREFSKAFYRSKQWKEVRSYIFNRDNGLCQDCGELGEEVHHKIFLTPENINNPEVTLNEDNLILLCKSCHTKQHRTNKEAIREGLEFNEFGELIQKNNNL